MSVVLIGIVFLSAFLELSVVSENICYTRMQNSERVIADSVCEYLMSQKGSDTTTAKLIASSINATSVDSEVLSCSEDKTYTLKAIQDGKFSTSEASHDLLKVCPASMFTDYDMSLTLLFSQSQLCKTYDVPNGTYGKVGTNSGLLPIKVTISPRAVDWEHMYDLKSPSNIFHNKQAGGLEFIVQVNMFDYFKR